MIVLVGSVTTILLDLMIPHITLNRIHTVFNIIRALRYVIQLMWIMKLGVELKKLVGTYNHEAIKLDFNNEYE